MNNMLNNTLKDLKKEIHYQWRVQSFSKNKPMAQCVAYIDSRDVQNLLDEVLGESGWQDDYKEIDGKIYAGIGIKAGDEWIWKWDCGVESNQDKEKGQASDAFKRAAVKWGIGRFLYKLPIKFVKSNVVKSDNPRNYPYVVDNQGKKIWNLTEHINNINRNESH